MTAIIGKHYNVSTADQIKDSIRTYKPFRVTSLNETFTKWVWLLFARAEASMRQTEALASVIFYPRFDLSVLFKRSHQKDSK